MLAFIAKSTLAFYGAFHDMDMGAKEKAITELTKLFGSSAVICSSAEGNDSGKMKVSELAGKLSKGKSKSHNNCLDCPYCSASKADLKYFKYSNNIQTQKAVTLLAKFYYKEFEVRHYHRNSHRSQAPPLYS